MFGIILNIRMSTIIIMIIIMNTTITRIRMTTNILTNMTITRILTVTIIITILPWQISSGSLTGWIFRKK